MKPRQPTPRKAVPGKRLPNPPQRVSVSAPREPRHGGGRWDAIISALDSWSRTLRLCLILFVATMVSSGVAAVVVMLVRHMLLGPRDGWYAVEPEIGCSVRRALFQCANISAQPSSSS